MTKTIRLPEESHIALRERPESLSDGFLRTARKVQTIDFVRFYGDGLVLASIGTALASGHYWSAFRVGNLITMPFAALGIAVSPDIASGRSSSRQLRPHYHGYVAIGMGSSLLCLVGAMVVLTAFPGALGVPYDDVVGFLLPIGVGRVADASSGFSAELMMFRGLQETEARLQYWGLVALVSGALAVGVFLGVVYIPWIAAAVFFAQNLFRLIVLVQNGIEPMTPQTIVAGFLCVAASLGISAFVLMAESTASGIAFAIGAAVGLSVSFGGLRTLLTNRART